MNHLIKVAGFQVPITGWFWVPADNRPSPPNKVKCESALGGLLNHYFVDAA